MEENEGKSKMPVKPIVAGLFVLAAVSVLAYAGYVYHRNALRDEALAKIQSQRDEVLSWIQENIGSMSQVRTVISTRGNGSEEAESNSMQVDSACSIKLVTKRSYNSYINYDPKQSDDSFTQQHTCRLNLSQLNNTLVKVSRVDDPSIADRSMFDDPDRENKGFPYWVIAIGKMDDFNCESRTDDRKKGVSEETYRSHQPVFVTMQNEDDAGLTAKAFKKAIQLCGGRDEPF